MEIYNVDQREAIDSSYRRAKLFFISFAISTPIYFTIEWFWPRHNRPSNVIGTGLHAILLCLLMSAIQSSRTSWGSITKPWAKYQIVVDENRITSRNFNSFNRMLSKSIHRNEIRTFVEKKQGLLISSRGRVATILVGGIWIPKQLADYENLRRLILNWREDNLHDPIPSGKSRLT